MGFMTYGIIALAASTSAPASQDPREALIEQQKQHSAECLRDFGTGKIKTYVALANCTNGGMMDMLRAIGFPYLDLAELQLAKRLVIAERIDKKKLTPIEGAAAEKQLEVDITVEVDKREQAKEKATLQAQAVVQARRDIQDQRQQAAELARDQARAQEEQANADRRAVQLRCAAAMLAPTRTGSFVESMSNCATATGR